MMEIECLQIFNVYESKLMLEKFDLENLGQGHDVQHSQLSHSLANLNLTLEHVCASSHRLRDIHISNFETLKMWVKVMMYNIRKAAIRWIISTSVKVVYLSILC